MILASVALEINREMIGAVEGGPLRGDGPSLPDCLTYEP